MTQLHLNYWYCSVRYDAAEDSLVTDTTQLKRILKRRYYLGRLYVYVLCTSVSFSYGHILFFYWTDLLTKFLILHKSFHTSLVRCFLFPQHYGDMCIYIPLSWSILRVYIYFCRYYLVEKAKDANMVGILVGTLGVGVCLDELFFF